MWAAGLWCVGEATGGIAPQSPHCVTILSILYHEFCHHLYYQRFRHRDSWHTRDFYERNAALYHQARGTPVKRLFWVNVPAGRWRIDSPRTNRGE